MTNTIHCQCKFATLYPDGAVRCNLTEKLATKEKEANCPHKHEGVPQIAKLADLLKRKVLEQPLIISQDTVAIKEKEIPVEIAELTPETKVFTKVGKHTTTRKPKKLRVDERQTKMF